MTDRPGTKRESSRERRASGRRAKATACSSCGAALARPFACGSCGALFREPADMDHFAFFGLERRFDVDASELDRSYLELSRLLHPDRQVPMPGEGQTGSLAARRARALALSAAMNAAHATLGSPEKRAEYLLRLLGGKTADQDKRTPPGFLQEQLELREEVEEAKGAKDRPRLETRLRELESSRDERLERVRSLFARSPEKEALAELRVELNALKYVSNLEGEIRSALAAEGP
ncbi:Fe-S protein assembly co-chaperone HscB [bacterium]|nr:Fe-S protein assembly co-chaperone HscB [bacterium]